MAIDFTTWRFTLSIDGHEMGCIKTDMGFKIVHATETHDSPLMPFKVIGHAFGVYGEGHTIEVQPKLTAEELEYIHNANRHIVKPKH